MTRKIMLIITFLFLLLIVLGIVEKKSYEKKLEKIPLKIYVNGTRGKSSTTRLIAASLREAGLKVIAKTTGSAARFIYEDGSEEEIKRNGVARISELMKGVSLAYKHNADALVMECMAVSPEMQWVSENLMVKSDIGVITNVYYDHQDKMGESLTEIADVLSLTIPYNAKLVSGEKEQLPLLKNKALKNKTKFYSTAPNKISDQEIKDFNYPVFKENISCALEVCSILDIDKDTALSGMKKAKPDLGALKALVLEHKNKKIYLLTAFAANDYQSTIKAWTKCKDWYAEAEFLELPLIGVFNHRADRGYRLDEIDDLVKTIPIEELFIAGSAISPYLAKSRIKNIDIKFSGIKKYAINQARIDSSIASFLDRLVEKRKSNLLLFGFGNIKGGGEKILKYFEENGEHYGNC